MAFNYPNGPNPPMFNGIPVVSVQFATTPRDFRAPRGGITFVTGPAFHLNRRAWCRTCQAWTPHDHRFGWSETRTVCSRYGHEHAGNPLVWAEEWMLGARNKYDLFYEAMIDLTDLVESFGDSLQPISALLRRWNQVRWPSITEICDRLGVTEADIRTRRVEDGVVIVRLWNGRTLQYDHAP